MKQLSFIIAAFSIFTAIFFHSTALAACDPKDDSFCCTKDSDCIVYVNPSLCVPIAMNKISAEKLEKENPKPSGECTQESVENLKNYAKTKKPVCISYGCDFDEAG